MIKQGVIRKTQFFVVALLPKVANRVPSIDLSHSIKISMAENGTKTYLSMVHKFIICAC